MSMDVCSQTLVLVDSDLTVSEVNQKLTKATLKYMFYHSPENRSYSFNEYEHEIVGQEEYVNEVNDLVCKVDNLVYEAKDSNIIDTLSEVLKSWKESDFACRDIVVFTDGLESGEINHEKEELYYLINNTQYPIYVVYLNQENNEGAKKVLSAIATTSSGELIETEFPGDDAEIDRLITDKLFAKMDEYAAAYWETYETKESEEENTEDMEEESIEYEKALADAEMTGEVKEISENDDELSSEVILRQEKPTGFFASPISVVVGFLGIAVSVLIAVLGSLYVMRLRRKNAGAKRNEPKDEKVSSQEDVYDEKTVLFNEEVPDAYDYATRLLTNESAVTLSLTEEGNADNVYTIYLGCKMSIGRWGGDCDVVIMDDDTVSKRHCSLCDKEGEVYVEDLSSSNGTFVNGKKITKSKLSEGDKLKIGSKSYCVRFA